MTKNTRNQIFLSYAHDDLETVEKVYKGLTDRGVKVWFDKDSIGIGKWKKKITTAIAHSRYFVICISEAALLKTGPDETKTGFQDEELDYAYNIANSQSETEFSIVPVRIEYCSHGDNRLSIFNQFDLFKNFEGGLDKLAVNIGGNSLSDIQIKDERTSDQKLVDALFDKVMTTYYANEYEKSYSGIIGMQVSIR